MEVWSTDRQPFPKSASDNLEENWNSHEFTSRKGGLQLPLRDAVGIRSTLCALQEAKHWLASTPEETAGALRGCPLACLAPPGPLSTLLVLSLY